jgi:hypothetical protein
MTEPRLATEEREFPARLARILSFRDPSKGHGHEKETQSA